MAYCGQGKLISERHVKLKGNAPLLDNDCTETGKQEKTVDITYDGRRRVLLAPWYRYRLRHSESALEQCVPKYLNMRCSLPPFRLQSARRGLEWIV